MTRLMLLIAAMALAGQGHGDSDPLHRAIATSQAGNRAEAASQRRIDRLDDQTKAMLDEYQRLSRELDQLRRYDRQLDRLLASQQSEQASLQRQLQALELTQRELLPLMQRMVVWLDELLALDRPFLPGERRARVEQLRAMLDRADIGIGEKYRRLLEAYQIEQEYGRTIEAYRGELVTKAGSRTVDFLRIGRLGLYYQTLDRRELGRWDAAAGNWQRLPDRYGLAFRDGLRIARKQLAPELLRLPVDGPVTAELQP